MRTLTLSTLAAHAAFRTVPPFGAEVAPAMKTIFDFKQFEEKCYFLDTQCTSSPHHIALKKYLQR